MSCDEPQIESMLARVLSLCTHLPQLVHEAPKRLGQLSIHAQRIVLVHVRLVFLPQELAHEGHGVRQALDARVHEACVAQVAQPS